MKLKSLIAIVVLMLGLSCIEELPLPTGKVVPRLVVSGEITQEAGPHTVQLFMTDTLLSGNYTPVLGATLKITNNLFQTVTLTGYGDGIYQTPTNWKAQIGKYYQLSINLIDGREYLSENQLLYPAGEIDLLEAEHKPNSINQGDAILPQHAVVVSIDGHGEEDQLNLFRWRWRGIYEVLTNPELYFSIVAGVQVIDPLPCSGARTGTPCICCNCWVTEKSTKALVSRNDVMGNIFIAKQLTYIPVDPFRFSIKYYFEVEQLSLSEEVHEFWKCVEAQQDGANNIFQPNAIKIRGNIHPVTNPNEEVFGIFSVSAVSRKSKFILSSDVEWNFTEPPLVRQDCRLAFSRSTNVRPDFW